MVSDFLYIMFFVYVGKYIINFRSYILLCMRIKYFMCELELELKNFRVWKKFVDGLFNLVFLFNSWENWEFI